MDTPWIFDFISIFVMVLASAFFSSAETALTTVSRARIYQLADEKNRKARLVLEMRERKEQLISTLLLGNTLVNIGAAAVATSFALKAFGGDAAVAYVTIVLTIVVLLFGEIVPKTLALKYAERYVLLIAWPIYGLIKITMPVNIATTWFTRRFLSLFGVDITASDTSIAAADVIRGTIELHHQEGHVIKHDRDMLGGILDLSDTEVSQVMVHRGQLESIDASQPVEELVRVCMQSSHSRLPIWQDNPDNIIGLLHIKDISRLLHKKQGDISWDDIKPLLIKPWFIPETTTLREQLLAFRQRKYHMALVVDEYGALLGIVTLEDIIEEIVGEIHDEHDRKPVLAVVQQPDGMYLVKGTLPIRDLNRMLEWDLPDAEDFSTVAGLVLHEARTIPEPGAMFTFFGYEFIVVSREANQLTYLKIRRAEALEHA